MKVLWVFFDKIGILFIFLLFFNSWEKFSTVRMPDGKYIHIKILCEWHAIKCVSWVIQQVERIRLTVCVCVLKSLKRQYQCLQPYTKDEWSFLTFFMHSKSLALHILLFIYKMAFLFRNMLSTAMLGKVLVQTWIDWLVVSTWYNRRGMRCTAIKWRHANWTLEKQIKKLKRWKKEISDTKIDIKAETSHKIN